MMEVVVTTGAIRRAKFQSNCHHQQTNIQYLSLSHVNDSSLLELKSWRCFESLRSIGVFIAWIGTLEEYQ